jgi:dethiobiotin synthetase
MTVQDLFVTGTDTNVGKTVLSALLVAALNGTYWKPIQTGASEGTDRQQVVRWADLPESRAVAECYCFQPAVSPHLAAAMSGVTIELERIRRPEQIAAPPLIIEGAGGVMVPINGSAMMIDLMSALGAPVVVASRTALGTINHTVLTVRALRGSGVCVKGVVMIGEENRDNERAIERYGEAPIVGRIPMLQCICYKTLVQTFENDFDREAFA